MLLFCVPGHADEDGIEALEPLLGLAPLSLASVHPQVEDLHLDTAGRRGASRFVSQSGVVARLEVLADGPDGDAVWRAESLVHRGVRDRESRDQVADRGARTRAEGWAAITHVHMVA